MFCPDCHPIERSADGWPKWFKEEDKKIATEIAKEILYKYQTIQLRTACDVFSRELEARHIHPRLFLGVTWDGTFTTVQRALNAAGGEYVYTLGDRGKIERQLEEKETQRLKEVREGCVMVAPACGCGKDDDFQISLKLPGVPSSPYRATVTVRTYGCAVCRVRYKYTLKRYQDKHFVSHKLVDPK